MTLDQIGSLIDANDLDGAQTAIDALIASGDSDTHTLGRAWFLCGRIETKRGRHARAITCYNNALAAAPGNILASAALQQATDILNFYHRDLYNP